MDMDLATGWRSGTSRITQAAPSVGTGCTRSRRELEELHRSSRAAAGHSAVRRRHLLQTGHTPDAPTCFQIDRELVFGEVLLARERAQLGHHLNPPLDQRCPDLGGPIGPSVGIAPGWSPTCSSCRSRNAATCAPSCSFAGRTSTWVINSLAGSSFTWTLDSPVVVLALVPIAHRPIHHGERPIPCHSLQPPRSGITSLRRDRSLPAQWLGRDDVAPASATGSSFGGRPRRLGPAGGPSSSSSATILIRSRAALATLGLVSPAGSTEARAARASSTNARRCSARA